MTRIQIKEGIPIEQQVLFFSSHQLKNENTLQHYNIKNDSTIHLTLNMSGGGYPPLPARAFYKVNTDDQLLLNKKLKDAGITFLLILQI